MPTTLRSSNQRPTVRPNPTLRRPSRVFAILVSVTSLLVGCVSASTNPIDLFSLAPESTANRAIQTRHFETRDSDEILSASSAVLQDLGFQITEIDRSLGFLRGSKERSAREYGQEVSRAFVAFLTFAVSVLGGANMTIVMPVDLQQQINATLIAVPTIQESPEEPVQNEVRIVFYRLVWKSDGQSGDTYILPGEQKMEMIRDAEIYQQFFFRLSKAVFLEAEKI